MEKTGDEQRGGGKKKSPKQNKANKHMQLNTHISNINIHILMCLQLTRDTSLFNYN